MSSSVFNPSNPIVWLRRRFNQVADPYYARFVRSGLPREAKTPIVGVRIGQLRVILKEIDRSLDERVLDAVLFNSPKIKGKRALPESLEERLAIAFLIGRAKVGFDRRVELVDAFLPYVDSWLVCDELCCALKWRAAEKDDLWNYLETCCASDKPYVVRFALVEYLRRFVDGPRLFEILEKVDAIPTQEVAVRPVLMGAAWLIAEAFVKQPDATMKYLRKNSLDDFTYNQALQKILDSLRVDPETKEEIRQMKRVKSRAPKTR